MSRDKNASSDAQYEQVSSKKRVVLPRQVVILLILIVFIIGLLFVYQILFQMQKGLVRGEPALYATQFVDANGSEMRLVSQGIFIMGDSSDHAHAECVKLGGDCGVPYEYIQCLRGSSPDSCIGPYDDQEPQHKIYLDAYYIDTYEVTNTLYKTCVNDRGLCTSPKQRITRPSFPNHYGDSQFDQYPVVNVTWEQAKTFCEWRGARLPTEAEWEKAARSTDGRYYPWGNTFDAMKTNFCDKNCAGRTSNSFYNDGYAEAAPVGSYQQGISPYEVYDLAGNVMEWVADWYDEKYYRNSPNSNPQGPFWGVNRVLRGGSWWDSGDLTSSADRSWNVPIVASDFVGFRCARSVP